MLKFITKLLGGSKSDKDLKLITPYVEKINTVFATLSNLTDEELKAKTDYFKQQVKDEVKEYETEKVELLEKLKNEALDADTTLSVNDRLKELDKLIFEEIDAKLTDLLPEAFAVVKEVCRRLTERKHSYEYVDNHSVWNMIPYDVQLIGGIAIHQGKIAEMATGEGKTLVAILPMYLNALSGKGVHLVTVNDYLARRDCEWMKPVFDFLGITVGSIQAKMDNQQRSELYTKDITYGTNNEFGFDYLRDNMVVEEDHQVQRGHWFAIVDEVDSVLIDEARTPLIISGAVGKSDQKFEEMNPRVLKLVDAQNKLVNQKLLEAANLLSTGKKEDKEKAGEMLLLAHRGLPKHKRLAKLLQEPENQKLLRDSELIYLRDQGRKMREIDEQLYYTIEEKNHAIELMEMGNQLITTSQEDPDMFIIPDIAAEMSALDGDTTITQEEKQRKVDAINFLYADRADRIHTVQQLLKAHSLYERDVEYVVQNGKVQIVDEHTGRILDGRRYSEGLHQAIEAKEKVTVERDTQTLATITLQNYYRMYNKLAGMTGTAETEAAEFEKIYNLEVVVIPTNRPITRKDYDDLIYKTKREKFNAIVEEVKVLLDSGRSVLVGTSSVEVSELLSKMLSRQNIKHNVLNAKQHEREAEIVANAGKPGAVTIATNMAGRGTDIKLDEQVKKAGGLAIVGSERHDSRRIDRQLRGRAGRQGDPGSSRFYISLEDNLMRLFSPDRIASAMQTLKMPEGEPIEHSMLTKSVERAQKKVEENNFAMRKRLIDYDDVMNQQREVIYTRRKHALRGERLKGEIFEALEEYAAEIYLQFHEQEKDFQGLKNSVRATLLVELEMTEKEFNELKEPEFVEKIIEAADKFYQRKEELLGPEFMRQLEKVATLQTIDEKWRDHLRAMDDLKEGIHLRSYGQKDPLLEYKGEAYKIFVELISEINKDTIHFVFKYFPRMVERQVSVSDQSQIPVNPATGAPQMRTTTMTRNLSFSRPDTSAAQGGRMSQQPMPESDNASTVTRTFKRDTSKIGRNDMVKVRYANGKVLEAKYKKVEKELEEGLCQLLD